MIDNPASYIVLLCVLIGFLVYVLDAYLKTKPDDYDPCKKYFVVESMRTELDWGKVNRKRRF